MTDIALRNASAYADRYHLRIAERLGFGIHGIVLVAEHEGKQDRTAIKAHNSSAFYARERAVYERLRESAITKVLGFHVPQLIRSDDELWVVEMTIVTRPFVLDFAGAHLDARPEFSEEVWAAWESQKREQFGSRWPTVESIMSAFEELRIYLMDVTPNNIGFVD